MGKRNQQDNNRFGGPNPTPKERPDLRIHLPVQYVTEGSLLEPKGKSIEGLPASRPFDRLAWLNIDDFLTGLDG